MLLQICTEENSNVSYGHPCCNDKSFGAGLGKRDLVVAAPGGGRRAEIPARKRSTSPSTGDNAVTSHFTTPLGVTRPEQRAVCDGPSADADGSPSTPLSVW